VSPKPCAGEAAAEAATATRMISSGRRDQMDLAAALDVLNLCRASYRRNSSSSGSRQMQKLASAGGDADVGVDKGKHFWHPRARF
jgi:hypothetical protein